MQLVDKLSSEVEMRPKQNPRSKNEEKTQMHLQKLWLKTCSVVSLALDQNIDQVVVNAQGFVVVEPVQYSAE